MSRRYVTAPKKKSFNKNRVFQTTIYPDISLREDDVYIYAKQGDRLDTLAYKYYGDVNDWWILARANDLGKGSLYVPAGTQLRIPTNIALPYKNLEQLNKNR